MSLDRSTRDRGGVMSADRYTGADLCDFLYGLATRQEIDRSSAKAYLHATKVVLGTVPSGGGAMDVGDEAAVRALLSRFEAEHSEKYSDDTLKTYKSRFRVAVALYRAYLDGDPNWKSVAKPFTREDAALMSAERPRPADGSRLVVYDLPLRPDLLIRINLPVDLNRADADRIATFVRSLAFDRPGDDE
jgi:hypothetical protein